MSRPRPPRRRQRLEFWGNPWTWPVRPPTDRGAWICACLTFAVGLIAFTVRGARQSIRD